MPGLQARQLQQPGHDLHQLVGVAGDGPEHVAALVVGQIVPVDEQRRVRGDGGQGSAQLVAGERDEVVLRLFQLPGELVRACRSAMKVPIWAATPSSSTVSRSSWLLGGGGVAGQDPEQGAAVAHRHGQDAADAVADADVGAQPLERRGQVPRRRDVRHPHRPAGLPHPAGDPGAPRPGCGRRTGRGPGRARPSARWPCRSPVPWSMRNSSARVPAQGGHHRPQHRRRHVGDRDGAGEGLFDVPVAVPELFGPAQRGDLVRRPRPHPARRRRAP